MVDYDAIPEDKRDNEFGTEDKPLPIISFKKKISIIKRSNSILTNLSNYKKKEV